MSRQPDPPQTYLWFWIIVVGLPVGLIVWLVQALGHLH